MCNQRRLRSAGASAHYDQRLCFPPEKSFGSLAIHITPGGMPTFIGKHVRPGPMKKKNTTKTTFSEWFLGQNSIPFLVSGYENDNFRHFII